MEGALAYTTLFFIPSRAPFDLYRYDYQPGVKLYIKRVFITESEKELLPVYMRFVRGIIDSEDLPLNVSREILQKNRIMENIRSSSVRKILQELVQLAKNKEQYEKFWNEFGRVLKEGILQDFEHRDQLLELLRYKSTAVRGLDEPRGVPRPDAEGPEGDLLHHRRPRSGAAQLPAPGGVQGARPGGARHGRRDRRDRRLVHREVHGDVELKAVNRLRHGGRPEDRGGRGQGRGHRAAAAEGEEVPSGTCVKDVRASHRLADSPSCIVVDEHDPTMQMQQILKMMGNKDLPEVKPILELNPSHPIVTKLAAAQDEAVIDDMSRLLLDQALLVEGGELRDPAGFVKRMNRALEKAL